MHHPLARLARCGVLEQSRGRGARTLRVSPRFLAHAEATGARLADEGRLLGATHALEAALASWDGCGLELRSAAAFLADFLGERDQMGGLRPVFPVLEQFALAA